jgi:fumarate reductase subunit C
LAFAVFHTVTWLNLSGVILRVKMGQKDVAPRTVTGANYAQWVVATIVVGALLIWLGM